MNKTILWAAGIVVAALLVYLTVLRVIPPSAPQDNQVAVQCGGKTVFRYKNADEMFPVMIKDYSASFTLATGVLNKLAGDSGNTAASADVKNTAQSLIDTLDQDNIFLQNMLKAYFFESNDAPCDDSLRYMYVSFITQMTYKQMHLKEFIGQVTNPPQDNGEAGSPTQTENGNKVLAVIDTASGALDSVTNKSPSAKRKPGKLYMLNNYKRLNTAVGLLRDNYYKSSKAKALPVSNAPTSPKK